MFAHASPSTAGRHRGLDTGRPRGSALRTDGARPRGLPRAQTVSYISTASPLPPALWRRRGRPARPLAVRSASRPECWRQIGRGASLGRRSPRCSTCSIARIAAGRNCSLSAAVCSVFCSSLDDLRRVVNVRADRSGRSGPLSAHPSSPGMGTVQCPPAMATSREASAPLCSRARSGTRPAIPAHGHVQVPTRPYSIPARPPPLLQSAHRRRRSSSRPPLNPP